MKVERIGIVLETKNDALQLRRPLEELYHWREPEEIDAIRHALESLGYTTVMIGTPKDLLTRSKTLKKAVDFIANLSVGFTSRFRLGLGPACYELAEIPYWGADPYTKIVSQNKQLLKSFLDKLGISTPPWCFVDLEDDLTKITPPAFPVIVKPAFEGSSIGLGPESYIEDHQGLLKQIDRICSRLRLPVIIEQFISGREIKVGLVGDQTFRFQGLIEDVGKDESPLGAQFLHFEIKKNGFFQKVPRSIHASEFMPLLNDCRRIFNLFRPLDYATFDIRINDQGQYFFLEFNADATLHPDRTLAQCALLNGLSYERLIQAILEVALTRQGLSGI